MPVANNERTEEQYTLATSILFVFIHVYIVLTSLIYIICIFTITDLTSLLRKLVIKIHPNKISTQSKYQHNPNPLKHFAAYDNIGSSGKLRYKINSSSLQ